jgi:hypothetical protein
MGRRGTRNQDPAPDNESALRQVWSIDGKRTKRHEFAREFGKSLVEALAFIADFWPN